MNDRDVETVARLLVRRRPNSWLRLIELVSVTEIVALAEAWLVKKGTPAEGG